MIGTLTSSVLKSVIFCYVINLIAATQLTIVDKGAV